MNDEATCPSPQTSSPDGARGVWGVGSVMWNIVKNVVIFSVLGPPLGALTLLIPLTIFSSGSAGHLSVGQFISNVLVGLGAGMLFSYFLGVLPALLAGAMVGVGQVLFRSFGFFHATAVGVAVGLALFWRPDLLSFFRSTKTPAVLFDRGGGDFTNITLSIAILGSICVVPTIVCWTISRRIPIEYERTPLC